VDIINPSVIEDIGSGRKISLNLGAGNQKIPGFYNVDLVELDGVDIIANLEEPLDKLADDSVSRIYSNQTFEHVRDLFGLLSEINRVCVDGAQCEIIVPHFANPYFHSDPTHVRQFGLFSMHYFIDANQQWRRKVPSYYSKTKFDLLDAQFVFYRDTVFDHLVTPLATRLVNLNRAVQHTYERRFCWLFPPASIKFILRVSK